MQASKALQCSGLLASPKGRDGAAPRTSHHCCRQLRKPFRAQRFSENAYGCHIRQLRSTIWGLAPRPGTRPTCVRSFPSEQGKEKDVPDVKASPVWAGDHEPGDLLGGKYEVVEVLGRGSNAVTYRARAQDGKDVAVKALSLRRMTGWKQLELFEREARTLESLAHPGIPAYLEFFEEDSEKDRGFFLVQELAQGRSLADLVESGWRADEAEVARIAKELLGILQYLASRRPPVTHRDVKPENVVLEGGKTGGRVFLVDFGGVQAAAASETLGLGSTVIGTYGYMAPEQFRGAAQPASDMYGLGGTLLYLLSGKPPSAFPQERLRIDFQEVIEVGPALASVLEGLLEPLVEDRISASDALATLDGQNPGREVARAGDQPPGARCTVRQKGDTLDIDIPPASLVAPEKVGLAGFALTWNAGIAVWTAGAIAAGSIFAAAFSIPFWAAGYSVAKEAFSSSVSNERFVIGPKTWKIIRTSRFSKREKKNKEVSGRTSDLKGVEVVTTGYINGVPRTELQLMEGFREHRWGGGLSTPEQQWLATKITAYLQKLPGQPAPTQPVTRAALPQRGYSTSSWNRDDSNGLFFSDPFRMQQPLYDDMLEPDIYFVEDDPSQSEDPSNKANELKAGEDSGDANGNASEAAAFAAAFSDRDQGAGGADAS